ncbi:MAG TPA: hypothetical protein VGM90_19435 [Kofleriaceae bacterium]|jgi:hypothetical protein
MSFDDVAKRMQQRSGSSVDPYPLMTPPTPRVDRGQAEVEAQFARSSQPIPSAVVVPRGATSAPTPPRNQPALAPAHQEYDSGEVMMRLARDEKRRSAKSDMVVGALMCTVGIVITAVTFSSASDGGGTYVIAWGPAIFGAIRFFRGLSRLA